MKYVFVAELFLSYILKECNSRPDLTDDDIRYPNACRFLKLVHHLHSSFEKSIIERTMQYIKDRTEEFDNYFPCKKNKCRLNHIKQWFEFS